MSDKPNLAALIAGVRPNIIKAIHDPGATEGYRGDRTLTEWQTDAVMRAILAALEAADHVNEAPKSEHDAGNVLSALPADVAGAVKKLVEALGIVRDYVADTASGCLQYKNRAPLQAIAQEDLARIDALIALATAQAAQIAGLEKERDELATANHRQASCIHVTAANLGPDCSATVDGLPKAARHVAAERDALLGAVKGLVEVLDQHETKGPLPDTALMFCWLAAQNVRAVLRGYMLEKPE